MPQAAALLHPTYTSINHWERQFSSGYSGLWTSVVEEQAHIFLSAAAEAVISDRKVEQKAVDGEYPKLSQTHVAESESRVFSDALLRYM